MWIVHIKLKQKVIFYFSYNTKLLNFFQWSAYSQTVNEQHDTTITPLPKSFSTPKKGKKIRYPGDISNNLVEDANKIKTFDLFA